MNYEDAANQLRNLIDERRSFMDNAEDADIYQRDIDALLIGISAIDHVKRCTNNEINGKPVKTNNFKLTFAYDGYEFNDVVNATDEQTAFSYLCWMVNDNDDLHFVKAEVCNEIPSYWCPVGWVEPAPEDVDVHIAWCRSLMKSLEVAGIMQHDHYTPELDKVMRSLGYTAHYILVNDDVFSVWNGKYIEYTRQNHHTLRVEIKEE